jgi:hypothetical protein
MNSIQNTIWNSIWKPLRFSAVALVLSPIAAMNVHAIPSDKEAWRSLEHGIVVYKDLDESTNTYWFVPKLRFESKDGVTFLRTRVLEDGRKEYMVRIIPYFSKELRELVAQNIPNIRQDSQLKPVNATKIGISLPDFNFKFSSASVTSYQYLDVPRLVRFTLPADEAEIFEELYRDEYGVNVDFQVNYDGVVTDKLLSIRISCDSMASELSTNFRPSVSGSAALKGVDAWLGADLERAFLSSVENSSSQVSITSKGNLPEMSTLLNRVLNLCFEPVDPLIGGGGHWDDYSNSVGDQYREEEERRRQEEQDRLDDQDAYDRRGTDRPEREEPIDPREDPEHDQGGGGRGGFLTSPFRVNRSNLMGFASSYATAADKNAAELDALHNFLSLDKAVAGSSSNGGRSLGGLLPEVTAKMRFKFKSTAVQSSKQSVVHDIAMKDKHQIAVLAGFLREKEQVQEKVQVSALSEKTFRVRYNNGPAKPFSTGIVVKPGQQWSINAAFIFQAMSSKTSWKPNQYIWDSRWKKPDGDLYFRVGSGHWTPVNARAIIESDVIGSGEIQFYLDRSSLYNKLSEEMRKTSWMRMGGSLYPIEGFLPEFSVQVSGRQISVR